MSAVWDGSSVRFWDVVWCVAEPWKFVFLELYRIACITDAFVADFVCFGDFGLHSEVCFTRLAQN